MKLIQIKRSTKQEKYYSSAMGILNSKVVYIKKHVLGFPVKTIHKYEVKDCGDCNLFN